jgi:hypothetical protein
MIVENYPFIDNYDNFPMDIYNSGNTLKHLIQLAKIANKNNKNKMI